MMENKSMHFAFFSGGNCWFQIFVISGSLLLFVFANCKNTQLKRFVLHLWWPWVNGRIFQGIQKNWGKDEVILCFKSVKEIFLRVPYWGDCHRVVWPLRGRGGGTPWTTKKKRKQISLIWKKYQNQENEKEVKKFFLNH